ncbi:MAG TPA: creatininase family protein [Stellaceae bacterium]|nr:creatininase family protein [Stellaceae bacterium]
MQPLEFSSLTAPALNKMAERNAIVVVPIGSTEQHGPHLPVMVDYRLATEVAMRGARKLAERGHPILVTPTIWTGFAEHHMELGGTITIDYSVFFGLVRGIVRSLVRDGFRRICLLNGHGGNIAPLVVAASELTVEFKIPLVAFAYWDIAVPQTKAILEFQEKLLHACEAETSMMMAVVPHLIDREQLAAARGPDQDRPEIENLVGPGVFRWQALNARSRRGVIGNGAAGTPEKGERLLDAMSERMAEVLGTPELWTAKASERW